MHLLETLWLCILVTSLTQVQHAHGNCDITSITSPSSTSLSIKWNSFPGATSYLMELRVVNSTSITPVVLDLTASTAEKQVQGLRSGSVYQVTLKVIQFYNVLCISSETGQTVPATSQITSFKAISSTSLSFQWSSAAGADNYVLVVEGKFKAEFYNLTFTGLSGQMNGLQPATTYTCYVYSSNAAGLGSRSAAKTVSTLVQPPEVVNVTTLSYNSAQVTWSSVTGVLLYRVSLTETNQSGLPAVAWNSTATFLNLPNLKPCTSYTIGVSSLNTFLQPGEPTSVPYTTSPVASVTSMSVDYSCSSALATINWNPVSGARSYRAVATIGNGVPLSCTSSGTSCQITTLRCGSLYTVHITTIADCETTSNSGYTFETAPCAPKNPVLYRECFSNVITFSWASTNNTAYYIATSVDQDGLVNECVTVDNACYFTQTECGRSYNFSVSSVYYGDVGCSSENTVPQTISTAPCDPQNARVMPTNCQSDTLVVTWDPTPGALNYSVEARGTHDGIYNCSTQSTSCEMTGVKCGQSLSVWITASNYGCITQPHLVDVADMAPCAPQQVFMVDTCGSFSVTLRWLTSNDAIFYTAKAVQPGTGTVHSCLTMAMECEISGLQCGQTYETFVMATNFICNSTESQHITTMTAPCAPMNVSAVKDCVASSATVQWQGLQVGGSYTATLQDEGGAVLNCTTNGNNCTVPSLSCGHTYNITVTQNNTICNSLPSAAILMDSVPCAPQAVVAEVNCTSGLTTVGWSSSAVAQNYTAAMWSGAEPPVNCSTSGSHCSVEHLKCGKTYNVEVLASLGTCQSAPSTLITVQQVPCVPTNVSVSWTCGMSSAVTTWSSSAGASAYITVATNTQGQRLQCKSNGTSCTLTNLTCGQEYTVGVMATNNNCTSLMSQTVSLRTEPCPPNSVSGMVDCSSSTASFLWSPNPNVLRYIGRLQSDTDVRVCNVSNTDCQISGLLCGQHYNFSVSSMDVSCASALTSPIYLDTAPCTSQHVSTSLSCDSNSLTVSWDSNTALYNYTATAWWQGEFSSSCSSQSSSCSMQGLQCGQLYNITVAVSSGNCSGPASPAQTIQTVPCVPQNVSGHVACGSNSLTASWDSTPGASGYIAVLSASGGFSQMCVTANSSCVFSGLQCASQYSIRVASQNGICNSTFSPATILSTGPCDPQSITATLQCSSNIATVTWNASAGANMYTVLAQTDGGHTLASSCSTSSTSCQLTTLTCGKMFNITVLAGDGSCNSTSQASTTVATAPCVPQNVSGHVACGSNSLTASWDPAPGASGYIAVLSASGGFSQMCVTANSSCVFSGLQCASQYSIRVASQNGICNSSFSPATTLSTGPCDPQSITAALQCSSNIATVTWNASAGATIYTVLAQTDGGHTLASSCSTSSTSCQLTTLTCGKMFNITVLAGDGSCNSTSQASTTVATAPCTPSILNTSLDCATNIVTLSWTPVINANRYLINATSTNGHEASCVSTNNSCSMLGLECGQTYSVFATAQGQHCDSSPSTSVSIVTVPCPPTMVNTHYDCNNNSAIIAWNDNHGSVSFVALMEGGGSTDSCTTTGISCSISSLRCGLSYSVSVKAVSSLCNSSYSQPAGVQTVPCAPQNVSAVWQCTNNSAVVAWSSRVGVSSYSVAALGRDGDVKQCNATSSSSCQLSQMNCGQIYNITVTPYTNSCSGVPSTSLSFNTGPCATGNLSVALNCETNLATASWLPALGADSYIATATYNGQMHTCVSNSTSCYFTDLMCGQSYSVTVSTVKQGCVSGPSAAVAMKTAPCAPSNVWASVDCGTNRADVSWNSTALATTYTAMLVGGNGQGSSCSSSGISCSVMVNCGQNYSVAVVASTDVCNSSKSVSFQLRSAPCTPQNITAALDCAANMLTVQWQGTTGSGLYSAVAVGSSDYQSSCSSSSSSSCSIAQLPCGQTYNVSVSASTSNCSVMQASSTMIQSAPCPPAQVSASLNCTSNSALVSWGAAPGVSSYMVNAVGSAGQNASCSTTGAFCSLSDLQCGQDYSIRVTALSNGCLTPATYNTTLSTAPCPSTNLQASLDCSHNSVLISWMPGSGTHYSNVTIQSLQIPPQLGCVTNESSCNINSLQCGQHYTITLTGYGQTCSSSPGVSTMLDTAPCAPSGLDVISACNSSTISVLWAPASGVVTYYIASVQPTNGVTLTCNTSLTSCDISGLACSQNYNVSVTAFGKGCTGGKSLTYSLKTAPCAPQNVQLQQQTCQAKNLSITWQPSNSTLSYYAKAVSLAGQTLSCNSANTSCLIPGLSCGQTYDVSVTAMDDFCNSSHSVTIRTYEAPCPPGSVTAEVNCSTNSVLVSWNTLGVVNAVYTARAVSVMGPSAGVECNTTNFNCSLNSLQCGSQYNVTVTAAKNNCSSEPSAVYTFSTAPCVPTLSDVVLDCGSGSALAVWLGAGFGAGGVDLYTVSAVDGQGGQLSCNNLQTPSCTVQGLHCGQTYTFSVTASQGQCSSATSNALQIHTAACPPQDVQVTVGCSNSTASVSWSPGDGAVSYMAMLQSSGHAYTCNTTATSCNIANLPCGQTFSVMVAAQGQKCNSTSSTGLPVKTAPCIPQNVSTNVNCTSNTATVSWQSSQGVALYIVKANSSNGQWVNCTSASTSCVLSPLTCGTTYSVAVKAQDNNCTSACSASVQLQTVPCVPHNVVPVLDCDTNNVSVSWSPSLGARLYMAALLDLNGLAGSCQSTGGQCNATGLRCGQLYHVSVTASDGQCNSAPSAVADIQSVPCPPSSIVATLNCTSDVAVVTWAAGAGSQSYSVSAVASLGRNTSCTSVGSGTSCELSNLRCGAEYVVSVQAHGAVCSSSINMDGYLTTEPCIPQHLLVQYDLSIAQLFWDFTLGAATYTALALTPDGLNATCPTVSDTNCPLSGTQCGQIYNLTVTAHNLACNGSGTATSSPYQFMTEPCPPQNIQARMNCSSLIASISWDASLVAVGYAVVLEGWNGDSMSYTTIQTRLSVPGLSCGTIYTTRVQALGNMYNSSYSDPVNLVTAPCVPTSVSVDVDCATDTALLSWPFSNGVDNYTAVVQGSGGHQDSCSTQQNQCNIPLQCGQSYNFTLISISRQCQIATFTNATFQSRPCVPEGVVADMSCGVDQALVSWHRSQGVDYYVARAIRGGDAHEDVCNSTTSTCLFSSLTCGLNYTFTVTAYSGNCYSNASQPVYVFSGSCKPENVTAHVSCHDQTVALDWPDARGAQLYLVSALGDQGLLLGFNTTASALTIPLPCGQSYNVTVQGLDQHCQSPHSNPAFFRTGPCVLNGLVALQSAGCSLAGVTLSWNSTAGADVYVVNGWSQDGHTLAFSTNMTTVSVQDLHCSQKYNFTVIASNQVCNSTSLPANIQTGPCSPITISAQLNCTSNVAVVSWQPSNGSAIYTATLLDSSGLSRSCVGVGTQCSVSGLGCGKDYSVSLTASNDKCNSTTTLPTMLQTGPCPPVNVSVQLDCTSNTAVVAWDRSQGATSYSVFADSGNISCQSSSPSCVLTNLACGSSYSVHVVAAGNNCTSEPSQPVVFSSVPCQPPNVSVQVDCGNGSAVLSWAAQASAMQYFAVAQSINATWLYCQSRNASCVLEGLQCGAVYNFTVMASAGTCNSSYSSVLTGGRVPCPPASLRLVASVVWGNSQLLRAYWPVVNCPDSRYLLEVSGRIQGNSQASFQMSSYWTNRTYFETPVPCSSTYSASIRAQNSGGTSAPSAVVTGISAPCPPTAVTFTGSNSSAIVAWNASTYATVYHVYQGQMMLCNTTQLSCTVTNVSSSLITVTAGNAAGESMGSAVTQSLHRRRRDVTQVERVHLAVAEPRFTKITADTLWLEWVRVEGAEYYTLLIREQSGSHTPRPEVMSVYGEASTVSGLRPSTTYCISVSARNAYSSGEFSKPACILTASRS